jgi:ferredoxin
MERAIAPIIHSRRIAFITRTTLSRTKLRRVQQTRCNRSIRDGFRYSGHIDTALLERIGVSRSSDFYLCGPSSFLQKMRDGLRNWGVLAENVHTEVFGALEGITPGMARVDHMPHLPQGPPGSGPSVSFARSGIAVGWDPRFESLLELAEACDLPVRWSCRTGVCHTCMTGLISGSITYQPEPLEKPAPGNVLVCCSQPNASVVLDL